MRKVVANTNSKQQRFMANLGFKTGFAIRGEKQFSVQLRVFDAILIYCPILCYHWAVNLFFEAE